MASEAAIELMTRPGCCLCDQAVALVQAVDEQGRWPLQERDISTSIELLSRYANHIPVLRRRDSGKELFWPFDEAELRSFLSS